MNTNAILKFQIIPALALFVVTLILYKSWTQNDLNPMDKVAEFTGFAGRYTCARFGMPDLLHRQIEISDDLYLFGSDGEDRVFLGQLKLIEPSAEKAVVAVAPDPRAFLERNYSGASDLRVAGGLGGIRFQGFKDGIEIFSEFCSPADP